MRVELVDPTQYPRWDEYLLSFGGHTVFHTSSWVRTLVATYRYLPLGILVFDGAAICGMLPLLGVHSAMTGRRGVSVPFSDTCPPLVSDKSARAKLVDAMKELARKHHWRYTEVRGGDAPEGYSLSARYAHHVVDVSRPGARLPSVARATGLRNARKARREGLVTHTTSAMDAVLAFYRLHCRTRRKHGVPPQPFHFFRNLQHILLEPGRGRLFVAVKDGRVLAAHVFLEFGDHVVYKFGASHERHLRCRPNDLLMSDSLEWYGDRGYRSVSLGRTDCEDLGLCRFKEGWGGVSETLEYWRCPDLGARGATNRRSRLSSVLRRTPLPVLRVIGALAYRHLG